MSPFTPPVTRGIFLNQLVSHFEYSVIKFDLFLRLLATGLQKGLVGSPTICYSDTSDTLTMLPRGNNRAMNFILIPNESSDEEKSL